MVIYKDKYLVLQINFTVDTETAKFVEYGNYHSYTFSIDRGFDNGLTENLLLSLQNDGSYKAVLITYNLTEAEKLALSNNEIVSLSNTPSFEYIDDQAMVTNLLSRNASEGCFAFTQIYNLCCHNQHTELDIINGQNCVCDTPPTGYVYEITYSAENCENNGGSNDDDNDDGTYTPPDDDDGTSTGNNDNGEGSNSGGNGNDTGNNTGAGNDDENPDDSDDPQDCLEVNFEGDCIGDVTSPLIPKDDCVNEISGLSEIINTPEIKAELNRLKFNMGFTAEEDGKRFIYTGTDPSNPDTYNDDNFNEVLPIKKYSASLKFPPLENNILVGAHFHPFAGIDGKPIRQVPSGTDIAEHINMIKKVYTTNPNAANQVTNFVVSKGNSGRTYILRANNAQNIVDNTKDYTIQKNRDGIWEDVVEILEPFRYDAFDEHEKAFNSYLSENFPDLDVLKAEYDANGNITKFCKLKTQ